MSLQFNNNLAIATAGPFSVNSTMIIRQALLSDSNVIEILLTQLGYPQDRNDVKDAISNYSGDGYYLMVAELNGMVVGFASLHWFDMFHTRGKIGRITAICIDEEVRSKRIGSALTTACEKFFAEKGCTKVEVTSNLKRTKTHEFYQKLGYVIDSRRFNKPLPPLD